MHTPLYIPALALACLAVGFAVGQVSASGTNAAPKRVTGIGGIFFKSKDPAAMRTWYGKHLGFVFTEWGGSQFDWRSADGSGEKGYTLWTPFKENTKYFQPSDKPFMINYRVANLTWLLEELKKEGIEPVGKLQDEPYGKFAHIMDPEGNKIELWEPSEEKSDKGQAK